MEELVAALFDMGIFTDEVITQLAIHLDMSQLDVAKIIDQAL